jgi:hypothetical protein
MILSRLFTGDLTPFPALPGYCLYSLTKPLNPTLGWQVRCHFRTYRFIVRSAAPDYGLYVTGGYWAFSCV